MKSPHAVTYYFAPDGSNPVSDFLDSLVQSQQAKLLRIIQTITMYGLLSVLPHVKKLTGTPFWEIRILGKDNLRVIYLIIDAESIILFHGFVKKTNKTSHKDLAIALSRYNEWKLRTSK